MNSLDELGSNGHVDGLGRVGLYPGGGWLIDFSNGGEHWTAVVTGWLLLIDGSVLPAIGDSEAPRALAAERRELRHPSGQQPPRLHQPSTLLYL